MTNIPTVSELINYYEKLDLLSNRANCLFYTERLKDLSVSIDAQKVRTQTSQLLIWPTLEILKTQNKILMQNSNLSNDDKSRINLLKNKQNDLNNSSDRKKIVSGLDELLLDDYEFTYLNPYRIGKSNFLNTVLSVQCEPLHNHIKYTTMGRMKIIHDAMLGGTIYIVGKRKDGFIDKYQDTTDVVTSNANYNFLQRSFICIDLKGNPVLFMDNIEGGAPYFRDLSHWRGYPANLESDYRQIYRNRISELYFAMGTAIHLAQQLGIRYVIPRDFELTQLSRQLGVGEKSVFSKEQGPWKIGINSKRRKKGVYTHSLYRADGNYSGTQLRYPRLEYSALDSPTTIMVELDRLYDLVLEENSSRKRKPTKNTHKYLEMINTVVKLIEYHPFSQTDELSIAYKRIEELNLSLSRFKL